MKIEVVAYRKEWKLQFERIREALGSILSDLAPVIEHVGSTSVENLSAKPIIDINVGVGSEAVFDRVVECMSRQKDYIYYQAFNKTLPQRRLFVKLNDHAEKYGLKTVYENLDEIPHEEINNKRLAHVHVWVFGSDDWIRHLAFRDYLRAHEAVKKAYGQLKMELSGREWPNGMEYNNAKDPFIKEVERNAVNWYLKRETNEF